MINKLQEILKGFGLGISKEELISQIYRTLKAEGIKDIAILNDKYLTIEGQDYKIIKSKKTNSWIVKQF